MIFFTKTGGSISFFRRLIAASVLTCLMIPQPLPGTMAFALAALDFAEAGKSTPLDIASFRIPRGMGRIGETFKGQDRKTVILIQDAHAIPDAQRNIYRLLNHLGQTHQISLVALEGASAPLDSAFFKTFPDQDLLRKVFEPYFERGELSGGTAAAILGKMPMVYHGVENWPLYEEGVRIFLQALKNKKTVETKLKALKKNINLQKRKACSSELLEVDRILADFSERKADIGDVLKKLSRFKMPDKGTPAAALLEALESQDGNFSLEDQRAISELKRYLTKVGTRESEKDLLDLNGKEQGFRTSELSAAEFAVALKRWAVRYRAEVRFSPKFEILANRQKKISEASNPGFFEEFEKYKVSVVESLFRNDQERMLYRRGLLLDRLTRLARLELDRKDWTEVQNLLRPEGEVFLDDSENRWFSEAVHLLALMKPNVDFYQNAQKREDEIQARTLDLMEKLHADTAALVAGGFHTEGIMQALRQKGISCVLVSPEIKSIPEKIHYRDHMRGDVSWKSYFKIENGKVNLYEAFHRGMRDRLLEASKENRKTILKRWRDGMIRFLGAAGQAGESGRLTRFLDEIVVKKGQGSMSRKWLKNVDRFIAGMRKLKADGRMTEQNISGLLKTGLIPSPPDSPAVLSQSGLLTSDLLVPPSATPGLAPNPVVEKKQRPPAQDSSGIALKKNSPAARAEVRRDDGDQRRWFSPVIDLMMILFKKIGDWVEARILRIRSLFKLPEDKLELAKPEDNPKREPEDELELAKPEDNPKREPEDELELAKTRVEKSFNWLLRIFPDSSDFILELRGKWRQGWLRAFSTETARELMLGLAALPRVELIDDAVRVQCIEQAICDLERIVAIQARNPGWWGETNPDWSFSVIRMFANFSPKAFSISSAVPFLEYLKLYSKEQVGKFILDWARELLQAGARASLERLFTSTLNILNGILDNNPLEESDDSWAKELIAIMPNLVSSYLWKNYLSRGGSYVRDDDPIVVFTQFISRFLLGHLERGKGSHLNWFVRLENAPWRLYSDGKLDVSDHDRVKLFIDVFPKEFRFAEANQVEGDESALATLTIIKALKEVEGQKDVTEQAFLSWLAKEAEVDHPGLQQKLVLLWGVYANLSSNPALENSADEAFWATISTYVQEFKEGQYSGSSSRSEVRSDDRDQRYLNLPAQELKLAQLAFKGNLRQLLGYLPENDSGREFKRKWKPKELSAFSVETVRALMLDLIALMMGNPQKIGASRIVWNTLPGVIAAAMYSLEKVVAIQSRNSEPWGKANLDWAFSASLVLSRLNTDMSSGDPFLKYLKLYSKEELEGLIQNVWDRFTAANNNSKESEKLLEVLFQKMPESFFAEENQQRASKFLLDLCKKNASLELLIAFFRKCSPSLLNDREFIRPAELEVIPAIMRNLLPHATANNFFKPMNQRLPSLELERDESALATLTIIKALKEVEGQKDVTEQAFLSWLAKEAEVDYPGLQQKLMLLWGVYANFSNTPALKNSADEAFWETINSYVQEFKAGQDSDSSSRSEVRSDDGDQRRWFSPVIDLMMMVWKGVGMLFRQFIMRIKSFILRTFPAPGGREWREFMKRLNVLLKVLQKNNSYPEFQRKWKGKRPLPTADALKDLAGDLGALLLEVELSKQSLRLGVLRAPLDDIVGSLARVIKSQGSNPAWQATINPEWFTPILQMLILASKNEGEYSDVINGFLPILRSCSKERLGNMFLDLTYSLPEGNSAFVNRGLFFETLKVLNGRAQAEQFNPEDKRWVKELILSIVSRFGDKAGASSVGDRAPGQLKELLRHFLRMDLAMSGREHFEWFVKAENVPWSLYSSGELDLSSFSQTRYFIGALPENFRFRREDKELFIQLVDRVWSEDGSVTYHPVEVYRVLQDLFKKIPDGFFAVEDAKWVSSFLSSFCKKPNSIFLLTFFFEKCSYDLLVSLGDFRQALMEARNSLIVNLREKSKEDGLALFDKLSKLLGSEEDSAALEAIRKALKEVEGQKDVTEQAFLSWLAKEAEVDYPGLQQKLMLLWGVYAKFSNTPVLKNSADEVFWKTINSYVQEFKEGQDSDSPAARAEMRSDGKDKMSWKSWFLFAVKLSVWLVAVIGKFLEGITEFPQDLLDHFPRREKQPVMREVKKNLHVISRALPRDLRKALSKKWRKASFASWDGIEELVVDLTGLFLDERFGKVPLTAGQAASVEKAFDNTMSVLAQVITAEGRNRDWWGGKIPAKSVDSAHNRIRSTLDQISMMAPIVHFLPQGIKEIDEVLGRWWPYFPTDEFIEEILELLEADVEGELFLLVGALNKKLADKPSTAYAEDKMKELMIKMAKVVLRPGLPAGDNGSKTVYSSAFSLPLSNEEQIDLRKQWRQLVSNFLSAGDKDARFQWFLTIEDTPWSLYKNGSLDLRDFSRVENFVKALPGTFTFEEEHKSLVELMIDRILEGVANNEESRSDPDGKVLQRLIERIPKNFFSEDSILRIGEPFLRIVNEVLPRLLGNFSEESGLVLLKKLPYNFFSDPSWVKNTAERIVSAAESQGAPASSPMSAYSRLIDLFLRVKEGSIEGDDQQKAILEQLERWRKITDLTFLGNQEKSRFLENLIRSRFKGGPPLLSEGNFKNLLSPPPNLIDRFGFYEPFFISRIDYFATVPSPPSVPKEYVYAVKVIKKAFDGIDVQHVPQGGIHLETKEILSWLASEATRDFESLKSKLSLLWSIYESWLITSELRTSADEVFWTTISTYVQEFKEGQGSGSPAARAEVRRDDGDQRRWFSPVIDLIMIIFNTIEIAVALIILWIRVHLNLPVSELELEQRGFRIRLYQILNDSSANDSIREFKRKWRPKRLGTFSAETVRELMLDLTALAMDYSREIGDAWSIRETVADVIAQAMCSLEKVVAIQSRNSERWGKMNRDWAFSASLAFSRLEIKTSIDDPFLKYLKSYSKEELRELIQNVWGRVTAANNDSKEREKLLKVLFQKMPESFFTEEDQRLASNFLLGLCRANVSLKVLIAFFHKCSPRLFSNREFIRSAEAEVIPAIMRSLPHTTAGKFEPMNQRLPSLELERDESALATLTIIKALKEMKDQKDVTEQAFLSWLAKEAEVDYPRLQQKLVLLWGVYAGLSSNPALKNSADEAFWETINRYVQEFKEGQGSGSSSSRSEVRAATAVTTQQHILVSVLTKQLEAVGQRLALSPDDEGLKGKHEALVEALESYRSVSYVTSHLIPDPKLRAVIEAKSGLGAKCWNDPGKLKSLVLRESYLDPGNEWMIGIMYVDLMTQQSAVTEGCSYNTYREILMGNLTESDTRFFGVVVEHSLRFLTKVENTELTPEDVSAIIRLSIALFTEARKMSAEAGSLGENALTIRELMRFYIDFSLFFLRNVESDGTHHLGNVLNQFILTAHNIFGRVVTTIEEREKFVDMLFRLLTQSGTGARVIFKAEQLGQFSSGGGKQKIRQIMDFTDYENMGISNFADSDTSPFEASLNAVIRRSEQVSRALLLVTNSDDAMVVENTLSGLDKGDGKTIRISASDFAKRKDSFGMLMPKKALSKLETRSLINQASPEDLKKAVKTVLGISDDQVLLLVALENSMESIMQDESIRQSVAVYLQDKEHWQETMDWYDGFLVHLARKAVEDPENQYRIIIDNAEALPGRVRVLLNPVLWEKRINVPERGESVYLPANLQFIFTMDQDSVVQDDSFLNRVLVHYTGSFPRSRKGYLQRKTGVSAIVEEKLQNLLRGLRKKSWKEDPDFSFSDLVHIGLRVSGRLKDHPELKENAVLAHEAMSFLKLRLGNREDWKALEQCFKDSEIQGGIEVVKIDVSAAGEWLFDGVKIPMSPEVLKWRSLHPGAGAPEILKNLYGFALTESEQRVFSQFARDWKYGFQTAQIEGPSGEGKTEISRVFSKMIGLKVSERNVNAETDLGNVRGRFVAAGGGGSVRFEESDYVGELEEGGYGQIFNEINTSPDGQMYRWLYPQMAGYSVITLPEFAVPDPQNTIRQVWMKKKNMLFFTVNSEGTAGRYAMPPQAAAMVPRYRLSFDLEALPSLVQQFVEKDQNLKLSSKEAFSQVLAKVHREIWLAQNKNDQLDFRQPVTRRFILRVIERMKSYQRFYSPQRIKNPLSEKQIFIRAVLQVYGLSWQNLDDIATASRIVGEVLRNDSFTKKEAEVQADPAEALEMSLLLEENPTLVFQDGSGVPAGDVVASVIKQKEGDAAQIVRVPLGSFHDGRQWVGALMPRTKGGYPGVSDASLARLLASKFPDVHYEIGLLGRLIEQARFLAARPEGERAGAEAAEKVYVILENYAQLNAKTMPLLNEFFQTNELEVLRKTMTQENADEWLSQLEEKIGRNEVSFEKIKAGFSESWTLEDLKAEPQKRMEFARWFYSHKPANLKLVATSSSREEIQVGGPELDRFTAVNISRAQDEKWLEDSLKDWLNENKISLSTEDKKSVKARLQEILEAYRAQKDNSEYEHIRLGWDDIRTFLEEFFLVAKSHEKSSDDFNKNLDDISYYALSIGLRPAFQEKLGFLPRKIISPETEMGFRKDPEGKYWMFHAGGIEVQTRHLASELSPKLSLVPTENLVRQMAALIIAWRANRVTVLEGYPGGGKSAVAEEFAAVMGVPSYEERMYDGIDPGGLLGRLSKKGGELILTANPDANGKFLLNFLKAYQGGGVFNLDEGAVGVSCQRLISYLSLLASQDELNLAYYHSGYRGPPIQKHPDFRLVITQNPEGVTKDRLSIPYGADSRAHKIWADNDLSESDALRIVNHYLGKKSTQVPDTIKNEMVRIHIGFLKEHPAKEDLSPRQLILMVQGVLALIRRPGHHSEEDMERAVFRGAMVAYFERLSKSERDDLLKILGKLSKHMQDWTGEIKAEREKEDYGGIYLPKSSGESNVPLDEIRFSESIGSQNGALRGLAYGLSLGMPVALQEAVGGNALDLVRKFAYQSGRDLEILRANPDMTKAHLVASLIPKFKSDFDRYGIREQEVGGEFIQALGFLTRHMIPKAEYDKLNPSTVQKQKILFVHMMDAIPENQRVVLNLFLSRLGSSRSLSVENAQGETVQYILPPWVGIVISSPIEHQASSAFMNRFLPIRVEPFSYTETKEAVQNRFPYVDDREFDWTWKIVQEALSWDREGGFELGYGFSSDDIFKIASVIQDTKRRTFRPLMQEPLYYLLRAVQLVYFNALKDKDLLDFEEQVIENRLLKRIFSVPLENKKITPGELRAYYQKLKEDIFSEFSNIKTLKITKEVSLAEIGGGEDYVFPNGFRLKVTDKSRGELLLRTAAQVYPFTLRGVQKGRFVAPEIEVKWDKSAGKIVLSYDILQSVGGFDLPMDEWSRDRAIPIHEIPSGSFMEMTPAYRIFLAGLIHAWQSRRYKNGYEASPRVVMINGETGAAKTSGMLNYALLSGIPTYVFNAHEDMRSSHLMTEMGVSQGKIQIGIKEFLARIGKIRRYGSDGEWTKISIPGKVTGSRTLVVWDEANVAPGLIYALEPLFRGDKRFTIDDGSEVLEVEIEDEVLFAMTFNPSETYGDRKSFPAEISGYAYKFWPPNPVRYSAIELAQILRELTRRGIRNAYEAMERRTGSPALPPETEGHVENVRTVVPSDHPDTRELSAEETRDFLGQLHRYPSPDQDPDETEGGEWVEAIRSLLEGNDLASSEDEDAPSPGQEGTAPEDDEIHTLTYDLDALKEKANGYSNREIAEINFVEYGKDVIVPFLQAVSALEFADRNASREGSVLKPVLDSAWKVGGDRLSQALADIVEEYRKTENVDGNVIEESLREIRRILAEDSRKVFLFVQYVKSRGERDKAPYLFANVQEILSYADVWKPEYYDVLGIPSESSLRSGPKPTAIEVSNTPKPGTLGYFEGEFALAFRNEIEHSQMMTRAGFSSLDEAEESVFFHEIGHMIDQQRSRAGEVRLPGNLELNAMLFPLIFGQSPRKYLQFLITMLQSVKDDPDDIYGQAIKGILNGLGKRLKDLSDGGFTYEEITDSFEMDRAEKIVESLINSKMKDEELKAMAAYIYQRRNLYLGTAKPGSKKVKARTGADAGSVEDLMGGLDKGYPTKVIGKVEAPKVVVQSQQPKQEKPRPSYVPPKRKPTDGKGQTSEGSATSENSSRRSGEDAMDLPPISPELIRALMKLFTGSPEALKTLSDEGDEIDVREFLQSMGLSDFFVTTKAVRAQARGHFAVTVDVSGSTSGEVHDSFVQMARYFLTLFHRVSVKNKEVDMGLAIHGDGYESLLSGGRDSRSPAKVRGALKKLEEHPTDQGNNFELVIQEIIKKYEHDKSGRPILEIVITDGQVEVDPQLLRQAHQKGIDIVILGYGTEEVLKFPKSFNFPAGTSPKEMVETLIKICILKTKKGVGGMIPFDRTLAEKLQASSSPSRSEVRADVLPESVRGDLEKLLTLISDADGESGKAFSEKWRNRTISSSWDDIRELVGDLTRLLSDEQVRRKSDDQAPHVRRAIIDTMGSLAPVITHEGLNRDWWGSVIGIEWFKQVFREFILAAKDDSAVSPDLRLGDPLSAMAQALTGGMARYYSARELGEMTLDLLRSIPNERSDDGVDKILQPVQQVLNINLNGKELTEDDVKWMKELITAWISVVPSYTLKYGVATLIEHFLLNGDWDDGDARFKWLIELEGAPWRLYSNGNLDLSDLYRVGWLIDVLPHEFTFKKKHKHLVIEIVNSILKGYGSDSPYSKATNSFLKLIFKIPNGFFTEDDVEWIVGALLSLPTDNSKKYIPHTQVWELLEKFSQGSFRSKFLSPNEKAAFSVRLCNLSKEVDREGYILLLKKLPYDSFSDDIPWVLDTAQRIVTAAESLNRLPASIEERSAALAYPRLLELFLRVREGAIENEDQQLKIQELCEWLKSIPESALSLERKSFLEQLIKSRVNGAPSFFNEENFKNLLLRLEYGSGFRFYYEQAFLGVVDYFATVPSPPSVPQEWVLAARTIKKAFDEVESGKKLPEGIDLTEKDISAWLASEAQSDFELLMHLLSLLWSTFTSLQDLNLKDSADEVFWKTINTYVQEFEQGKGSDSLSSRSEVRGDELLESVRKNLNTLLTFISDADGKSGKAFSEKWRDKRISSSWDGIRELVEDLQLFLYSPELLTDADQPISDTLDAVAQVITEGGRNRDWWGKTIPAESISAVSTEIHIALEVALMLNVNVHVSDRVIQSFQSIKVLLTRWTYFSADEFIDEILALLDKEELSANVKELFSLVRALSDKLRSEPSTAYDETKMKELIVKLGKEMLRPELFDVCSGAWNHLVLNFLLAGDVDARFNWFLGVEGIPNSLYKAGSLDLQDFSRVENFINALPSTFVFKEEQKSLVKLMIDRILKEAANSEAPHLSSSIDNLLEQLIDQTPKDFFSKNDAPWIGEVLSGLLGDFSEESGLVLLKKLPYNFFSDPSWVQDTVGRIVSKAESWGDEDEGASISYSVLLELFLRIPEGSIGNGGEQDTILNQFNRWQNIPNRANFVPEENAQFLKTLIRSRFEGDSSFLTVENFKSLLAQIFGGYGDKFFVDRSLLSVVDYFATVSFPPSAPQELQNAANVIKKAFDEVESGKKLPEGIDLTEKDISVWLASAGREKSDFELLMNSLSLLWSTYMGLRNAQLENVADEVFWATINSYVQEFKEGQGSDSLSSRSEVRLAPVATRVVMALRPAAPSSPVVSESDLSKIRRFAVLDFEEFAAALRATAEKFAGEVRATNIRASGEGESGEPASLNEVARIQSQKLMDWFKNRPHVSGKLPIGLLMDLKSDSATSFLSQLLENLEQRGQGAIILTDRNFQPEVAKALEREALAALIVSRGLSPAVWASGNIHLDAGLRTDLPIAFGGRKKTSASWAENFIGIQMEDNGSSRNLDVAFYRELLFTVSLVLMAETLQSENYLSAIQERINQLSAVDRNDPAKLRRVKAMYLRESLAKALAETGHPPAVLSFDETDQLISLSGSIIEGMLLDMRASAKVATAA